MLNSATTPLLPMTPTGSSLEGSVSSPTTDQVTRRSNLKTSTGGPGTGSVKRVTTSTNRPPYFIYDRDSLLTPNKLYRRHSANESGIAEEDAFLLNPRDSQKSVSSSKSTPRECILPISEFAYERANNRQRLVSKEGHVNVEIGDLSKKELTAGFFDLYTTFLELKWTNLIVLICSSLIFSWAFFALLWYIIITYRGDIGYRSRNHTEPYVPCVNEVDSYVTAFLYTLEAQTTIGFGSRNPTDRCPESVFLLVIQTVLAVCQAGTIGAIMAGKFIKPNRRKAALKMSKFACVESPSFTLGSELVIRMYDLRRKTRIIVQNVYGVLLRNGINPKTGEPKLTYREVHFHSTYGMGAGNILLTVFPVTLVHEVDETSPFLGMQPSDLTDGSTSFELIVAVDGMMECNGLAFRKLSSYLPDEIKLGHGFEDFTGSLNRNRFTVNFNKLESVRPVPLKESKSTDF